ncbi:MAG: hypothetical protein AAFO94_16795 [Bacteroidota bacterium]
MSFRYYFRFFSSFFFCLLLSLLLPAQNTVSPTAGAKGAGMGNAMVALQGIESAYANQAGLATLDRFAFNLTAENRFLLPELSQAYLAAAFPTNSGTFALTLRHFGFSEYNEQKIGLAYARQLFDQLSIGVQFDYLNTRINEYGSQGVFTFEAGLQTLILRKLQMGAHVFSPVSIALSENENLPTILRLGIAYLASDKVTFAAEVEKDIDLPAQFRAGFEYQIANALFLRLGLGTNPTSVSFGVGYRINRFQIDVASNYHQILGVSPAGSFSYQ